MLAGALDCLLRRARNRSRSKPSSRAVPARGRSAKTVDETETDSANFFGPSRGGQGWRAARGSMFQLDITPVIVHSHEHRAASRVSARRPTWQEARLQGMTAVEIENVLATPELHDLFEQAEQHGSLRYADLIEVLEPLHLDPLETDAVFRELEQRGIEVSEPEAEPEGGRAASAATACRAGDDDRRPAAVPTRRRPPSAADGRAGGRARQAHRARRAWKPRRG